MVEAERYVQEWKKRVLKQPLVNRLEKDECPKGG